MRFLLIVSMLLLSATLCLAASWEQDGDNYNRTAEVTVTFDQQQVYDMRQAAVSKQDLLNRLNSAHLTQADGVMLEQIASMLRQGVSIADQKTAVDAEVSEIPEVADPNPGGGFTL